MKRSLLISLFFVLGSSLIAQDSIKNFTLSYTIHGNTDTMAWFCEVYGPNVNIIDSVKVVDGSVFFSFDSIPPAGVYKVIYSEEVYTDIIINNENVNLQSSADNIILNMNVIESLENKIMFDYWKFYIPVKDTMNAYAEEGRRLLGESQGKVTKPIRELLNKAIYLELKVLKYASNLLYTYPESLASKLIWSYQKPDYQIHLASGGVEYPSQEVFYRQRFFDRLDFSDERLLRSKVVFSMVNDYIQTFASPPSTKKYIRVVDTILSMASVNPEVYQYLTEIFLKNFEPTIWDKVFLHIVEKHYLTSPNTDPYLKIRYRERANAIKRLTIGNKIPEICGETTDKKSICLRTANPDSEYTLIFIWSLNCEHCESMLPGLIKVYKQHKDYDFNVFSFTFAENVDSLQEAIDHFKIPFDNVSDYKGFMSEVVDRFNVSITPVMILVDKDFTIIEKPATIPQLYGILAARMNE